MSGQRIAQCLECLLRALQLILQPGDRDMRLDRASVRRRKLARGGWTARARASAARWGWQLARKQAPRLPQLS
jgi:hypothetical protein